MSNHDSREQPPPPPPPRRRRHARDRAGGQPIARRGPRAVGLNAMPCAQRRAALMGACACAAAAAATVALTPARAADWDPVPGVAGPGNFQLDGGPGAWDLTTANWTANAGATNVPWPGGGDAAVFGGATGGVVTISTGGAGVFAASLLFQPTTDFTTYTIAAQTPAADVLTLLTPAITANHNATISAPIAGAAGLEKLGPATLVLASTANTFSGPVTVSAGTLAISSDAQLGNAANGVIIQNAATLQSLADIDPAPSRVF